MYSQHISTNGVHRVRKGKKSAKMAKEKKKEEDTSNEIRNINHRGKFEIVIKIINEILI